VIARALALLQILLLLHPGVARSADAPAVEEKADAGRTAKSPAERKIAIARADIARLPQNPDPHNALALALVARARETADAKFYAEAGAALKESHRLAPDNLAARRIDIMVQLGRHLFPAALADARELNKLRPDDVLVYSLLADACVEMGDYDEAENAAQWALDMRPGEVCGLMAASRVREIYGDLQGAIDLVQSASLRIPPEETGDRAELLIRFAHLQILNGQPARAEAALDEALKLCPSHPAALAQMVKVRTAQKRPADAVAVAGELCRVAPTVPHHFILGEALLRTGEKAAALQTFMRAPWTFVECSPFIDDTYREAVFYYTDHVPQPAAALRIADRQIDRRHDAHTRHARAWALYANEKYEEAAAEMDKALAPGIREPAMLYHAGMIAAKLGRMEQADRYLRAAIATAPESEVSALVRAAITLGDATNKK